MSIWFPGSRQDTAKLKYSVLLFQPEKLDPTRGSEGGFKISFSMKEIKTFYKTYCCPDLCEGQGLVFVFSMTFLLDISVITSGDFYQDRDFGSDELNETFSYFQLLYLIIFYNFCLLILGMDLQPPEGIFCPRFLKISDC